jgi:ribosomal protein L16/L10AE
MKFSLLVNAGSSKPTSRAARIQEANKLYEMHVVDQQFVLQAYRVSHWQAVQQRTKAEAEQQATLAAIQGGGKGQPKGPGTGHPH